jgi:hypothetical protein
MRSLSLNCPNLESLSSSGDNIHVLHLNTPKLTQLSIVMSAVETVTFGDNSVDFGFPPLLVYVRLERCKYLGKGLNCLETSYIDILTRSCPDLITLSTEYSFSPKCVRIAALDKLETLNISYLYQTESIAFDSTPTSSSFPALTKLDISQAVQLLDITLPDVETKVFPTLHDLSIAGCKRGKISSFAALISSCPNLRALGADDLPRNAFQSAVKSVLKLFPSSILPFSVSGLVPDADWESKLRN